MLDTSLHLYALALGSNRPLSAILTPPRLIEAAVGEIAKLGRVVSLSPAIVTPPMGPSLRLFVNAAMVVETALPPDAMLDQLQKIERDLGRRRHRRWGARRMDIDIILWSGGCRHSHRLQIPHPAFRQRDFVLAPLLAVASRWRDPVTGLTIRHLGARLLKKRRTRRPAEVDHRHAPL